MTVKSWVAVGFDEGGRIAFHLLDLLDSLTEPLFDRAHILVLVEQSEVRLQIFKDVRFVVKQVDILPHEDEEGRADAALHGLASEGVHIVELQLCQETGTFHLLGSQSQALVAQVNIFGLVAQIFQREV